MEQTEGQYYSQLTPVNLKRIQNGLRERGLISWQSLNLPKDMECVEPGHLDDWVKICEDRNIDPKRVVIDDNNINYKWVADNYEFKASYIPNELYKLQYNLLPCNHVIPETNLHFMAGNYSFSRWQLLEIIWRKGLLTDSTKLFWSAYRSGELHDEHNRDDLFSAEFLEFMFENMPRTFMIDKFYNKYPEELNLGTREQRYINDYNNNDTWIYEHSLISVVVDTMSNRPNLDDFQADKFPNVYTTPKSFKAIKHKRPFILAIAKQSNELAMLRELGFETFDSVWSEEYDKQSFHKRLDHMGDLCYNLSNENTTELYHATIDICEHNYNVLMDTDWIEWYLQELDKQHGL